MEFDEQKAIEYINLRLTEEGRQTYDEDQLLNVVDMIWDFYEENGLLEIDSDPDEEADDVVSDVIDYVLRMLKKDKSATINPDDVPTIVTAEIDYEDTCL